MHAHTDLGGVRETVLVKVIQLLMLGIDIIVTIFRLTHYAEGLKLTMALNTRVI